MAVALALALASGAALANGHARPQYSSSAPGAAAAPAGRAGAGAPATTARFTLEFVDAELVDVFQALATQSGVNIALSGSVKGKTTLRLRNVTLEQALNIVTKLNGLDYAWVEAAYVVGTPEEVRAMRVSELRPSVVVLQHIQPEYAQEVLSKLTPEVTVSTQPGVRSVLLLAPEPSLAKAERVLAEIDVPPMPTPPTTEVVALRHLKADQVAELIASAVPEAVVQPGPQENSLLITADSQQWQSIRSLVSSVDAAPAPAQATQRVHYVRYTEPEELQSALVALLPDARVTLAPRSFTPTVTPPTTGAGGSAQLLGVAGGGAARTVAPPVTALIVSGAPWTVERAMEILEELDVAPRQIHIAAMITEINRDDISRLGIDWVGLGAGGAGFMMGEPSAGTLDPSDDSVYEARRLAIGRIQRSHLQWAGSIHALEEQGRARVLSNPSVTTVDGRETALHTGETFLYPVTIAAGTVGGAIQDTREAKVGVTLSVRPYVNDDGEITLAIAPNVAAVTGFLGNLPIISNRSVVTTVRVRSGETAVIAGLVTEQERTLITKVPLLGDVPLLGELFKYRRKNPARTEVLVLVTPTVLES